MKNIVILGSTGSIGKNALEVISRHRDKFRVVGLTARGSLDALLEQINQFNPDVVAVSDHASADKLKTMTKVRVLEGVEGVCEVARFDSADFVLSAIVGFAGLAPTLSAVRAGKTIGLANKESLVVAGEIVMSEAKKHGSTILPVDSEHSAVFQCLGEGKAQDLRKITLTASGGPFVGKTCEELQCVGPEDAVRHPNWSMGKKISVDSATLMNKGFEVIEACHLFNIPPDMVDVVIHPESIVHCIVEFHDGSTIAHMSVPDMKGPIAFAMSYPERLHDVMKPLNLASIGKLTFTAPDHESFPCLGYAFRALKEGGTMPAVLNASNEVAVDAFLRNRLRFSDMPLVIKDSMLSHQNRGIESIESVIEADKWARRKSAEIIASIGARTQQ